MKQAIFIGILILAFCNSFFAQSNENTCPKIIIKAPDNIQAFTSTKVYASFENEKQPSTSKFNWIIIKENNLSKISESGIIEIDSENMNGGTIILLAESLNSACQNTSMARISVIPRVGSPRIYDEYSEMNWSDEKARLYNIVLELQTDKDSELLAILNFDKNSSQAKRKRYLTQVFDFFSKTQGISKDRITFLISESSVKRVTFQSIPKDFFPDFCDNCFVIRGEDLEKIESLFQTNTNIKNRNK